MSTVLTRIAFRLFAFTAGVVTVAALAHLFT